MQQPPTTQFFAYIDSLITEEMHLVGLEVQDSLGGRELRRLSEIRATLDQLDQLLERRPTSMSRHG